MKKTAVILAFLAAVLNMAAQRYALVDISTAYVRSRPSHAAELVTQQLMGFPVKILSSENEWSKVETIDGYTGYIIDNTLQKLTPAQYRQWKSSDRVIVTGYRELPITGKGGGQISDVTPGAILQFAGKCPSDSTMSLVVLPDGRRGCLPSNNLMSLEQWSKQPYSAGDIIAYAMDNLGAPYLWGGMSPKGMDCSGLTWTAYWLNGRLLQRDASKQALMSAKITGWEQLKAGDLAFFGNPTTGKITHVALLRDNSSGIVHASQGRVRLNSLDPAAPDHIPATFLWGISLSDLPPIAATDAYYELMSR